MQQEWESTRVPRAIKGIRTPSIRDQQLVPGRSRDEELWPQLESIEMNLECFLRHGGIKRRSVLGSPHFDSSIDWFWRPLGDCSAPRNSQQPVHFLAMDAGNETMVGKERPPLNYSISDETKRSIDAYSTTATIN